MKQTSLSSLPCTCLHWALGAALSISVVSCGGKTLEDAPAESTTSTACPQHVGTKPVEHACSHTTNGPFENVIASRSADEAPTVNAIHVSYLVDFPSDGEAFVMFRPNRSGEHLFLLDRESPLAVRHRTTLERPLLSDAIAGCETASFGEVYDLVSGESYLIEFETGSHSPTLLFFEHLATFGNGAWQEGCLENE